MQVKRNFNMELLRIISMFMVLVLHCLLTTGALEYSSGIRYYVYWFMEALCIIAVDVFVLITGYFMIESKFKAKNVFKTAISGVWVYSFIFSILAMKMGGIFYFRIDSSSISCFDKKILVC